jgi:hypothetical protein
MTLFWQVVGQNVEQESGSLLDHALGLEDVYNSVNLNQWTTLVLRKLRRELGSLLRTQPNLAESEM